MLPPDPFGRPVSVPTRDLTRREKVRMIQRVAARLLELGGANNLFVGGALDAWLENGGDLVRHYLRVSPDRGSKRTPQRIARELADEAAEDKADGGL
jgi:hypothetical protein